MEIKIVIDETRIGRALKRRRVRFSLLALLVLAPMVAYAATLAKPYTFKDGDVISAAQINDNFDKVYDAINTHHNTPHFPSSNLISQAQGEMINGWVGAIGKTWKLCYASKTQGLSASTFHGNCNNRGETVTVLKTASGKLIGGYTGCSWASIGQYNYGCGGSFLFSLTNKHRYDKHWYHNGFSNTLSYIYYTYDHSSYGPTWGGGHDLYLDLNSNTGSSCNLGHDYTCRVGTGETNSGYGTSTCRVDFCGTNGNFAISEIEVWYSAG